MNPITYIIFDFDGTIADTIDLALNIYNRIAPEFKCKPIHEEDKRRLRVRQTKDALEEFGITKVKLVLLLLRIRKEMSKNIAAIKLVEGIKESLHALKNSGLRLGILTSNSTSNVSLF